jgi:hypothetical protein
VHNLFLSFGILIMFVSNIVPTRQGGLPQSLRPFQRRLSSAAQCAEVHGFFFYIPQHTKIRGFAMFFYARDALPTGCANMVAFIAPQLVAMQMTCHSILKRRAVQLAVIPQTQLATLPRP